MTKTKVVLQKNVFDALELSALIHGGIGTGCLSESKGVGEKDEWNQHQDYIEVPSCIIGHGLFLDGYDFHETNIVPGESPVLDELVRAFPALLKEVEDTKDDYAIYAERGLGYGDAIAMIETLNDRMVSQFAACKISRELTLTWKQWCKRMHVVRGDA